VRGDADLQVGVSFVVEVQLGYPSYFIVVTLQTMASLCLEFFCTT
jgi:hypothetical protein